MVLNLELTARKHAVTSGLRSIVAYGILIFPWFLNREFSLGISWVWAAAISLAVPTIVLLILPLEKVADKLVRHLRPEPPTRRFDNVVSEIAVALNEPVESIQTYGCPVANIAMLPCSKSEIVVATTGALERLSRNELQALVAAQFAGMRDRWCRLATRAEIMWWSIPWCFPLILAGLMLGCPAASIVTFASVFFYVFLPRYTEQARDLCADVAAVRTTFDPGSLGNAMRKLAEQANEATRIDFGAWYLPTNPFLVIPRRNSSTTTVSFGGKERKWHAADEVRLELLLRADRAEALADGADPGEYTGREFRRRWRELGR